MARSEARPDFGKLVRLPPLDLRERPRIGGLFGGSLGLVLALLLPGDRRALVLHADARESADVAGDLSLFGVARERRLFVPDLDDDEKGLERLAVLQRLRDQPDAVVLSSVSAAAQPAPVPAALEAGAIRLAPGTAAPGPLALAARLGADGWTRVSLVTAPGEYSVRGDVLDLFAPGAEAPVRLEYFGDELERIRAFDADTQRAAAPLERLDLAARARDAEMGTLLDHFGADAPVFLVEPTPEDAKRVERRPGADLDALRGGDLKLKVLQIEPVTAGPEQLRERIEEACARADRAFFACRNEAEENRVKSLLGDGPPAPLRFLRGRLSRSFELPDRRLAVLGYDDLLQHLTRRRPPQKRIQGRAIEDFLDLEPGDHVVHLAHGVGLFRGVERISKDGAALEHCIVEFQDGVRVFVPVTKIDLIQKYVGASGARPRLARLGGVAWAKAKARVKEAVTDLAVRLLETQAMRQKRPGIVFPMDTDLQHQFEASFPYEETPDQITTLEAVKKDMETPRPMDRLMCGDVGYGKTELAMRAAFKAVLAGRQVAVLVPTTVLAAQHFATFRERMAGYPIRVEMLSRFRTEAEAKAIGEGLGEGTVDIVIGTHRLLSPGIAFKDLGLVIIDEEQRFGVEHKERFKALRATVDVLTLTATPIPRTLNMALLGLKDISTLTTPPEGRMAVATEVSAFDERKIRDYIVRELRRGGQVYFVHNRIETIGRIDRLVATLVPEARRAVVHGRMPRHELEDSMMAFVRGEIDVLVATTIVESGLDIPNANTLIVDRAHRIGLADLHQLRGRVGRGRHRGHALFLLPEEHKVTDEVAERRLRTIEEHAGLGSGFRIALKDLEIRGAGNLLGAEQSGYIADVGYELYCRLLEDAVKELRRERVTEATDTYVDLHVAAGLSDEYAGDPSLKLGFYRRIASVATLEDLEGLRAELEDRCGSLPEGGQRLFDVARLRIVGQEHGIARFSMERDGTLQMSIGDPSRALPFLREKLGRSLRQPKDGLAIVAEPVKPAEPSLALARFLALPARA
ncbi:MAG TPA: transcription-repair coupling factor [Planctomycetota bacterium]|nr:transcription-repair coupling factor [Planctomycetota bacterium]